MFPTLASLLEERMRDDLELTHAAIHALNEWLYETWSFDYEGRIFATPVITLPIVDRAVEELEWVLERGARTVLVRPAPVPGYAGSRSPALPEFDPFWERVVEADIPVSMHASDSGYARYKADWTGPSEYLPFVLDSFQLMMDKERPITDTMTALVCHGLFTRFPDLRVLSVENGAEWVAPFVKNLRNAYKKMPQAFGEDPIEAFRRNVWVCPFHEDDFEELVDLMGVDHLCFGSDYPHPEGLAEPCSFADHLPKSMSDDDTAAVMGGNLSRIMRVPAAA
jgi:predicted TIM-barrel fold metal-dependent hydrolase